MKERMGLFRSVSVCVYIFPLKLSVCSQGQRPGFLHPRASESGDFCLDKMATLMALLPHRYLLRLTPYQPELVNILLLLSLTLELPDLANKITGCPIALEFRTSHQ